MLSFSAYIYTTEGFDQGWEPHIHLLNSLQGDNRSDYDGIIYLEEGECIFFQAGLHYMIDNDPFFCKIMDLVMVVKEEIRLT